MKKLKLRVFNAINGCETWNIYAEEALEYDTGM